MNNRSMTTEETIQQLAEQAKRCDAMWNRPLTLARELLATTRREDTPMIGGRRNIDPIGDQA